MPSTRNRAETLTPTAGGVSTVQYDASGFQIESLDDLLGYDADHTDPSQYCRHGTVIGSWWGPDYACGYCESGE